MQYLVLQNCMLVISNNNKQIIFNSEGGVNIKQRTMLKSTVSITTSTNTCYPVRGTTTTILSLD